MTSSKNNRYRFSHYRFNWSGGRYWCSFWCINFRSC